MTKIRSIGGVTGPVATDEPSAVDKKEADEIYADSHNAFNILAKCSGTRLYARLTPEEEKQIDEDLKSIASAILLYNTEKEELEDELHDVPMNEFVCLYAELEERRFRRTPRNPSRG